MCSLVATTVEVPTAPIAGMKPGTSGLRKKVEVWQGVVEENKYYVENFLQSLLDTAKTNNNGKMLDTIIVAGDGRYYNNEAFGQPAGEEFTDAVSAIERLLLPTSETASPYHVHVNIAL